MKATFGWSLSIFPKILIQIISENKGTKGLPCSHESFLSFPLITFKLIAVYNLYSLPKLLVLFYFSPISSMSTVADILRICICIYVLQATGEWHVCRYRFRCSRWTVSISSMHTVCTLWLLCPNVSDEMERATRNTYQT